MAGTGPRNCCLPFRHGCSTAKEKKKSNVCLFSGALDCPTALVPLLCFNLFVQKLQDSRLYFMLEPRFTVLILCSGAAMVGPDLWAVYSVLSDVLCSPLSLVQSTLSPPYHCLFPLVWNLDLTLASSPCMDRELISIYQLQSGLSRSLDQ